MIRTSSMALAVFVFAAPALAQTNAGSVPETAPLVEPAPAPAETTLPGVTDGTTTGSTAQPADQERCELPGRTSDSNPTADVPSVTEADPTCR